MSEAVEHSAQIDGGGDGRRQLDPAFKRNLVIIGVAVAIAVALVVVIFMARGGSGSKAAPDSTVAFDSQGGERKKRDELPPRMREQLAQKQVAEAKEAAARNESYVPPDTTGATHPVVAPMAAPNSSLGAANESMGQAMIIDRTREENNRRQGLDRLVENMTKETAHEQRQRVVFASETGPAQVSRPSGTTNDAPSAAAVQGKRVIRALDIVAARMSPLSIPSGRSAFVLAEVTSGEHKGALMTGSAKVLDESLEIVFDRIRIGDQAYAIEGVALDEQTAAGAIAGNVDRRLLSRYLIPMAMAAAQGFFNAKAQTGSTFIGLSIGGTTGTGGIATPPATTEQARSAGLAAGLQIASQDAQRLAQQPIVVSTEAGKSIGVMFKTDVLEKGKQ